MIDKLNQFISLFIDSFKMFGWGRIWLILLVLSGINALVLFAHVDFLSPLFYPIITWWTNVINPAAAKLFTHYPGHYLTLPFYFGLARLAPGFLFEGLLLGWTALWFRRGFMKGGNLPTNFGSAMIRWPHLTGCWVIVNGLFMLVSIYLPDLLSGFHQDSPRRLMLVDFMIVPFVFSLILALFYYALAAVAAEGLNLFQGISRSFKLFLKRPLTSFFLAAIIMSGPFILTAVAARSGDIIDKFKPEMVAVILFVNLAVEVIANFFWMSTAVRFLLEESEE